MDAIINYLNNLKPIPSCPFSDIRLNSNYYEKKNGVGKVYLKGIDTIYYILIPHLNQGN